MELKDSSQLENSEKILSHGVDQVKDRVLGLKIEKLNHICKEYVTKINTDKEHDGNMGDNERPHL